VHSYTGTRTSKRADYPHLPGDAWIEVQEYKAFYINISNRVSGRIYLGSRKQWTGGSVITTGGRTCVDASLSLI
jgi:hypothetical protein